MSDGFNKKIIELSFRKFKDYSSDVIGSDHNTFDNRLNIFIYFCENDSVMKVITNQLKAIDTGFDEWWESINSSGGGSMIGTKNFNLPVDEEVRNALLYEFTIEINKEEIDLKRFAIDFFGKTNFNDMIGSFNDAVFYPMVRSIGYKIEEIMDSIEKEYKNMESIPEKVMFVYQNITHIEGSVKAKGDIVIGEEGRIEKE